jgi:hypothetical protein
MACGVADCWFLRLGGSLLRQSPSLSAYLVHGSAWMLPKDAAVICRPAPQRFLPPLGHPNAILLWLFAEYYEVGFWLLGLDKWDPLPQLMYWNTQSDGDAYHVHDCLDPRVLAVKGCSKSTHRLEDNGVAMAADCMVTMPGVFLLPILTTLLSFHVAIVCLSTLYRCEGILRFYYRGKVEADRRRWDDLHDALQLHLFAYSM